MKPEPNKQKLVVGQRVRIVRGYRSGTKGTLTSYNKSTGECVIRPTPLTPMLTHSEYLEPVNEQNESSTLNIIKKFLFNK